MRFLDCGVGGLLVLSFGATTTSVLNSPLAFTTAFTTTPTPPVRTNKLKGWASSATRLSFLEMKNGGSGDDHLDADDDDEDMIAPALEDDDDQEVDWRAFRAKLVMGESKTMTTSSPSKNSSTAVVAEDDLDGIGSLFFDDAADDFSSASSPTTSSQQSTVGNKNVMMTPLDPSQWAYDSGDVIEQGAVILGGVEQEFGFGLRQQYFHKALILVLDHEESVFTKGILLNRPTDLLLQDDVNPGGKKWRVWFGGDVQGIHSKRPDITCIHSLKHPKAVQASIPVMKSIQWTTFDNAKKLVKAGIASVDDFWVFVGYAGWGPGQLSRELVRKSWYMVATDSGTLLSELAKNGEAQDPRDAGLDTWNLLMNMIGREETAKQHQGTFDDLMLKEWAFENLLSSEGGGNAGNQERSPDAFDDQSDLVQTLMQQLQSDDRTTGSSMDGALVRAAATDRSPFRLDEQEFINSLVLIIADGEDVSIGCLLNRPSSKGIEIVIKDKASGESKTVTIPLRFGGPYAVSGRATLLWLHYSPSLRKEGIGSPVSPNLEDGIWKCTQDDVVKALSQRIATVNDFIVVSGVAVWSKLDGALRGGISAEVDLGKFEPPVASSKINQIWEALTKQKDVLSLDNLDRTLQTSHDAWRAAGDDGTETKKSDELPPLSGLGENFDEDDDSFVFKTNKPVAELCDEALRLWVSTFLLSTL